MLVNPPDLAAMGAMTASSAKPMRSWMFVPGNKDRFLQKAKTSDADAVLFDLEDGVLPAE